MKGFLQILILIIFFRSLSYGQEDALSEKKSLSEKNFPGLKITVTENTLVADAKVLFIPEMTLGLDPSWDISGYGYDEDFHVYTKLIEDNGHSFYIQCLPNDNYSNYSIPVGFNFTMGGRVSFKVDVLNDLTTECLAIFEDRETGDLIDLRKVGSKYTIDLPANSNITKRFILHTYDPRNKSLDMAQMKFGNLKIYSFKNEIHIKGDVKENYSIELYNISGKLVYKTAIESGLSSIVLPTNVDPGVYLCRIQQKSASRVEKLFLQ